MVYCGEAVTCSPLGRVELDPVEAVGLGRERGRQRAVARPRQRDAVLVADHDPSARRGHRRRDGERDVGAGEHRDVAAVLDLARLEAGVGREAVLQIELLHVRELDHLQREHRTSARLPLRRSTRGCRSDRTAAPRRCRSRPSASRRARSSPPPPFLKTTAASAASKPESVAAIVWSAPFGTVASPGLTSIRYGAAASTLREITNSADSVWRRRAGPNVKSSRATATLRRRPC